MIPGETNKEFQARWSQWLNTEFSCFMHLDKGYYFDFCKILEKDFAEFMRGGRFT